ncbi:MAG: hypothetical protein IJU03_12000 [Thermoguttaceae bacterium]|nr:hypothetical protein [Thermoguttaceae bacterium]
MKKKVCVTLALLLATIFCRNVGAVQEARVEIEDGSRKLESIYERAASSVARLTDAVKLGIEDADYGEGPEPTGERWKDETTESKQNAESDESDPNYRYEPQTLEAARKTAETATNFYRRMQAEETPLTNELKEKSPETLLWVRTILEYAPLKYQDNPIVVEVFMYFGLIAFLSTAFTLLNRTLHGASPAYLWRSKFYEIPQIRVALKFLSYFAYAVVGVFGFFTIRLAIVLFEVRALSILVITIAHLIVTILLYFFARWFRRAISEPYPCNYESARKAIVKFKPGVKRSALRRLGRESFPEMLEYGYSGGVGFRRLVLIAQVLVVALFCVVGFTEFGKDQALLMGAAQSIGRALRNLYAYLPTSQPALGISVGVVCATSFFFMLLTDAHYLVVRFSKTVLLALILGWGALAGLKTFDVWIGAPNDVAFLHYLIAVGVWNLAIFIRWKKDLKRAKTFRRRRALDAPIISALNRCFKFMPRAQKDKNECELDPIDKDAIAARVSRGLYNVESESFAALRNMIRFLGRIKAEYERFIAAQLNALVVTRRLASRSLGGTSSCVCSCHVPIWDESEFPFRPPRGYEYKTDTDWLNYDWNFVSICGGCGGSGYVTRTETEYKTRQVYDSNGSHTETYTETRYVRETCGACNGWGRIEYQQGIVTEWTNHCVSAVAPETPLPEYMSAAAESVFYQRSFREHFHGYCDEERPDDGASPKILQRAEEATNRYINDYADSHLEKIADDYNGKIYRARVRFVGFWTIRIVFRRVFGKFGWFFGKRPDFYFKMIPLSWSAVVSVCVVAPFCLACLALATVAVLRWTPVLTQYIANFQSFSE